MPEGDTLHRTARTLSRALGGQKLVRVSSPLARVSEAKLTGLSVSSVEAIGKNLIIRFDDGRALHTHLRMNGAWHIYRPHEHWRRPVREARVVLDVGDIVAVCFAAPLVRLVRARAARRDVYLAEIGPDLVTDAFDEPEALRRLAARGATPLGEAIVDQTALSGIGNIFKSESLFLCGADPFAPVASLPPETLAAIVREARRLLRENVDPKRRVRTTHEGPGGRYWVYLRSGEPCFRCETRILMKRQGELGRSTYYCPRCQPSLRAHGGRA